ncbi:MAG: hypothetical protein AB8G77_00715 [Rhodothermales bacterium]
MTSVLKIISYLGLGLTVIPSMLVFSGDITWERHALLMLIGTLMWFGTAPFWMKDKEAQEHAGS